MKTLLRWIGRLLVVIAVLVGLAWLAVTGLRMRALGPEERAAVALMEVPPPVLEGSNGFAALMLADYDVPPAEQDAALAADVARFEAWLAENARDASFIASDADGGGRLASFEAFADAPGPKRPPVPGHEAPLCPLRTAGCLARVQAAPDPVRALLQEHAARTADVERALAADHLYNVYPETLSTPLPPLQAMRLPLTAAALDAVDGRVPDAYARTCRLLAGARRMDREGRNLVEKFVAQALGEGAAQLLLELRRAHPVAALPAGCAPAMAAVDVDEAAICSALRGEYRTQRAIGRQLSASLNGGWRPDRLLARALLVDADLQDAWSAGGFAPYCTDEARALAADGVAPPPPPPSISRDDADCYAAMLNCTLMQIGAPQMGDYSGRALDHAAILRLLLAAQAVADGGIDAQAAATAAGDTGHPVTFDAQTLVATIALQSPRGDEAPTVEIDFAGLAPVVPETSFAALTD
jgi:hypothetical protein